MEDIHNKFIQSWHTGVPVKELCKQFNICKSTAYNWIKLYSPIKRPEKETITAHKIYQLERYQTKSNELEKLVIEAVSGNNYRRAVKDLERDGKLPVSFHTAHGWGMRSGCDEIKISP